MHGVKQVPSELDLTQWEVCSHPMSDSQTISRCNAHFDHRIINKINRQVEYSIQPKTAN